MGALMEQLRCKSCGEMKDPKEIYNAQFWDDEMPYLAANVCRDCAEAFIGGKMHAEATTDHSKL